MATFLFDSTIFGPVYSRRLGSSLGINLLPNTKKVCNFNCIYCECGLTPNQQSISANIPERNEIKKLLEEKLIKIKSDSVKVDTITFAGNGEPTLHPQFPEIIDDVIEISSKYLPEADIAVLSNSTLISDEKIYNALLKVNKNILKLDSVIPETQKIINCPMGDFSLENLIKNLKKFRGNLIIQTLFFRGSFKGKIIDNSNREELDPWLKTIGDIKPQSVMIYTIARDTPVKGLEKIDLSELNKIGRQIEQLGIKAYISP